MGKMGGHPRFTHHFVGKNMTHLGFVRPIGKQINVGHSRGIFVPTKSLRTIEIDVVTLLRKTGRGLSMPPKKYVVVKLAIII